MSHEQVCSAIGGGGAGGLLREAFAFAATAARTTCAGCARVAPIGELRLYAVEMGAILRPNLGFAAGDTERCHAQGIVDSALGNKVERAGIEAARRKFSLGDLRDGGRPEGHH